MLQLLGANGLSLENVLVMFVSVWKCYIISLMRKGLLVVEVLCSASGQEKKKKKESLNAEVEDIWR